MRGIAKLLEKIQAWRLKPCRDPDNRLHPTRDCSACDELRELNREIGIAIDAIPTLTWTPTVAGRETACAGMWILYAAPEGTFCVHGETTDTGWIGESKTLHDAKQEAEDWMTAHKILFKVVAK